MIAGPRQLEAVINAVSYYSGFPREELLDRWGGPPVSFYRQLIMFIIHKHGGWGLKGTAEYLGRNHPAGTVACERIEKDPQAVALAQRLWGEVLLHTEDMVEAFPRQETE